MNRYPGMSPDQSGSNAFYSDENLLLRAQAASYEDFAPLPGEDMARAVAASPALQGYRGAMTPLNLADIEVDDGGRSADYAAGTLYEPPNPPTFTPNQYAAPPAPQSDARIDQLEQKLDSVLSRIEKLLGGN